MKNLNIQLSEDEYSEATAKKQEAGITWREAVLHGLGIETVEKRLLGRPPKNAAKEKELDQVWLNQPWAHKSGSLENRSPGQSQESPDFDKTAELDSIYGAWKKEKKNDRKSS